MTTKDFLLVDHCSIAVLIPMNENATNWIDEHIRDALQWGRNGIVIEARYVADILDGINCDGLTVA